MEKMLVVVFDNEAKAYEGARSLNQLDTEGSITIHAESVIKKNADGTVSVLRTDGDFPVRTIGGTAIGSLIGAAGRTRWLRHRRSRRKLRRNVGGSIRCRSQHRFRS